MAVLQAARAQSLGLPRDSAYSWGLNRAIFYAAAKRGFSGNSPKPGEAASAPTKHPDREAFRLGQEEAFRNPHAKEIVFTIGEQDQTVEEFERSVASRFGTKENFRAAWEEALQVVGAFPRATLESQGGFYQEVYKPRRDDLSDEWTQKYSPAREKK
jgi:hypothetical protein